MSSIRRKLATYMLVGSGALLLSSGLVLNAVVDSWLGREFDRALEAKARALVILTKEQRGEVELDFADEFMPEFEAEVEPEYFEIWLGDVVLERSNSLGQGDLARIGQAAVEASFTDVVLPDGRSGRKVQIDFVPQNEDDDADGAEESAADRRVPVPIPATLVVAMSRHGLDAQIRFFGLLFTGFAVILMAGLAILVRLSLRSGLRPLTSIGSQVETLDAGSLGSRIDLAETPEEFQMLVDKLNDLLRRLDQAFHRERRMSSDIAHELRTPIAELRNLAEVGGRWPDDPETVRSFFQDVEAIALQMERTIADLLALARSEGGMDGLDEQDVDLTCLMDAVWARVAPEAERRDVTFANEVPAAIHLRTDREKLERILHNLVTNAATYSRPGSRIRCSAQATGEGARLVIANQAENLTEDDLPHVFDRFWRKDASRTGNQNAGLGLSIVRAFADLLAFDIDVGLDADQTFRVTLESRSSGLRSSCSG